MSEAQLPARREPAVVADVIPVLDTARFEHMQRIAAAMAGGSLLPETLRMAKRGDQEVWLSHQEALANCFLIVNQAVRWGMDPFALAQCVSVVHGKLCYEGKVVAALIDAKLGVRLRYTYEGEGDGFTVTVSGRFSDEEEDRAVVGAVADWKTVGKNGKDTAWSRPANHRRMLAYRGSREWARLHAPALLLGVYSDDELEDLAEIAREGRNFAAASGVARPVLAGVAARLQAPPGQAAGFSATHVASELDAVSGEQVSAAPEATAALAPTGPEPVDDQPILTELQRWGVELRIQIDGLTDLDTLETVVERAQDRLAHLTSAHMGDALALRGVIMKARRRLEAKAQPTAPLGREVRDETVPLFPEEVAA